MDLLPENLDCERFVLGALLSADPNKMPVEAVLTSLAPSDFHLEKHRRILDCMTHLQSSGMAIDRVTVANELQRRKQLQAVDGLSYLVSLDEGLPRIHNLDEYIGILREKSILRKIIAAADNIRERAMRSEKSADLADNLRRIGEGLAPTEASGMLSPSQIIDKVGINELITPAKSKHGIVSPWEWLNKRMRFWPKTLTVLAGETGQGKSSFALQLIECAARQGQRTALYSMEMSQEQNLRRMFGQVGRVNMHRLMLGVGDREEREQAMEGARRLVELDEYLLIDDSGTVTIPLIRQNLQRRDMAGAAIRFLVVDYLQLMTGAGRFGSRADEVSSIARGLKLIAQDFGIPVLALSQFSRPDGKAPNRKRGLADLKESSEIEQAANHVIFLERITEDEEADLQDFLVRVKKQREGPKGGGKFMFIQRYARFEEVEDRKEAA